MKIDLLDHGYIRFIEAWGHGEAGKEALGWHDYECGIIEAARQSTQGNFRGWAPYKMCEKCGRIWTEMEQSGGEAWECEHEWKNYPRGDEGLLSFLFSGKPQHATPFEFCGLVIEVRAPIFVFREWHRHRTQSYNEMSARYAPLPDYNYVPTVERCMLNSAKNKQAGVVKGADELEEWGAKDFQFELLEMYEAQEKFYQKWLKRGIPKELARIDLPVGRYSQMRAQANLRNWLAFMTLRSDPGAQWEIQQYSNALGEIIAKYFPRTWKLYQLGRTSSG